MEIVCTLSNFDMYNNVSSKVDGIVLGTPFSFYANHIFTEEEIMKLILLSKKDGKKVFLLLNLVMHEEYKEDVRILRPQTSGQSPYCAKRQPHISAELFAKPSAVGNIGKAKQTEVFSVGARVCHAVFGAGTVLSVREMGADTLYEIAFDNVGTKKLMATYAKLRKI